VSAAVAWGGVVDLVAEINRMVSVAG